MAAILAAFGYSVFAIARNLSTVYISVLGDSFSSYEGKCPRDYRFYYDGNRAGVSTADEMWWNVLCSKIGAKPLVIEALSGCTVTEGVRVESLIAASNSKRCHNLGRMLLYPDIIIVAVGVNDYSLSVPLWKIDYVGTTNKSDNFCFSYANMLAKIKRYYPKSTVVCVSPWFTQRGQWDGTAYRNDLGLTYRDYSVCVERIALQYDCLFFDTNAFGFHEGNYYPQYCVDDAEHPTHPNAEGQRLIGEMIADWIVGQGVAVVPGREK